MNWAEAESYCNSTYGTTLATIRSSTENKLAIVAAVYSGVSSVDAWIGFNDMDVEGTFEWIDGSINNDYTNWASGEPSNSAGNEHCGQIWYDGNNDRFGTWNDASCDASMSFVCNAYPRTTLGM